MGMPGCWFLISVPDCVICFFVDLQVVLVVVVVLGEEVIAEDEVAETEEESAEVIFFVLCFPQLFGDCHPIAETIWHVLFLNFQLLCYLSLCAVCICLLCV